MQDNGDAFAVELDRYRQGAIRIATREVGSADAEDVVQEAMLAGWQARDTFDAEQGSLKGWFYTIVDRKCRDHVRRRNGRGSRPQPVVVSLDDPGLGLADSLSGEDEGMGIDWESMWDYLSPRQRDVMTLFLDGMQTWEIAADLRISPTAVRTYKHRAVTRVRKILWEGSYGI